jgi:hypothetical protein
LGSRSFQRAIQHPSRSCPRRRHPRRDRGHRDCAYVDRAGGRRRIADELALVERELKAEPVAIEARDGLDETTGLIAPSTAAEVRRRVLLDVVLPRTEALLRANA